MLELRALTCGSNGEQIERGELEWRFELHLKISESAGNFTWIHQANAAFLPTLATESRSRFPAMG